MEQQGRKSAESLAVVVTMPGQRPEPPAILSPAEAALWRQVVSSHPHDWFTSSIFGLLVGYVSAWARSNEIKEALARYPSVPEGDDFKRWRHLLADEDKQQRLMATLGTKLRITPHSMRSEREAATGVRKTMQTGRKPWESVDQG